MDKGILSNVNPMFNSKEQASPEDNNREKINLFSNSFATNIRGKDNNAENKTNEEQETEETNLLSSLGVPTGVNIEGFDYASFISQDDVENTETTKTNTSTNPIEMVQQYQENKVTNIYKMMNKDIVNDLTDLISKF